MTITKKKEKDEVCVGCGTLHLHGTDVMFDWSYKSVSLNGVEYIRRKDIDNLLNELSEVRLKCIEKITLSEKKSTWVRRKD